jgi:hypothetical protein
MKTQSLRFDSIVESVYSLPLEERLELKNLLEHNIADARREEIALHYKDAQGEHEADKLKFSSNMEVLKKML